MGRRYWRREVTADGVSTFAGFRLHVGGLRGGGAAPVVSSIMGGVSGQVSEFNSIGADRI
jgi:hypothetical protein